MSTANLGGSSTPSIAGTVVGVGSGALVLPHTGSSLVSFMVMLTIATGVAMFTGLAVSKLSRKTR